MASSMPWKRATNCANAPHLLLHYSKTLPCYKKVFYLGLMRAHPALFGFVWFLFSLTHRLLRAVRTSLCAYDCTINIILQVLKTLPSVDHVYILVPPRTPWKKRTRLQNHT